MTPSEALLLSPLNKVTRIVTEPVLIEHNASSSLATVDGRNATLATIHRCSVKLDKTTLERVTQGQIATTLTQTSDIYHRDTAEIKTSIVPISLNSQISKVMNSANFRRDTEDGRDARDHDWNSNGFKASGNFGKSKPVYHNNIGATPETHQSAELVYRRGFGPKRSPQPDDQRFAHMPDDAAATSEVEQLLAQSALNAHRPLRGNILEILRPAKSLYARTPHTPESSKKDGHSWNSSHKSNQKDAKRSEQWGGAESRDQTHNSRLDGRGILKASKPAHSDGSQETPSGTKPGRHEENQLPRSSPSSTPHGPGPTPTGVDGIKFKPLHGDASLASSQDYTVLAPAEIVYRRDVHQKTSERITGSNGLPGRDISAMISDDISDQPQQLGSSASQTKRPGPRKRVATLVPSPELLDNFSPQPSAEGAAQAKLAVAVTADAVSSRSSSAKIERLNSEYKHDDPLSSINSRGINELHRRGEETDHDFPQLSSSIEEKGNHDDVDGSTTGVNDIMMPCNQTLIEDPEYVGPLVDLHNETKRDAVGDDDSGEEFSNTQRKYEHDGRTTNTIDDGNLHFESVMSHPMRSAAVVGEDDAELIRRASNKMANSDEVHIGASGKHKSGLYLSVLDADDVDARVMKNALKAQPEFREAVDGAIRHHARSSRAKRNVGSLLAIEEVPSEDEAVEKKDTTTKTKSREQPTALKTGVSLPTDGSQKASMMRSAPHVSDLNDSPTKRNAKEDDDHGGDDERKDGKNKKDKQKGDEKDATANNERGKSQIDWDNPKAVFDGQIEESWKAPIAMMTLQPPNSYPAGMVFTSGVTYRDAPPIKRDRHDKEQKFKAEMFEKHLVKVEHPAEPWAMPSAPDVNDENERATKRAVLRSALGNQKSTGHPQGYPFAMPIAPGVNDGNERATKRAVAHPRFDVPSNPIFMSSASGVDDEGERATKRANAPQKLGNPKYPVYMPAAPRVDDGDEKATKREALVNSESPYAVKKATNRKLDVLEPSGGLVAFSDMLLSAANMGDLDARSTK